MTGNSIHRPIVVGVDGSAAALRAARWAADEAARRRLPLRLVQVIDVVSATGGFAPPRSFFTTLETEGRRQLTEAEAAVRQDHPELEIEPILRTAGLVSTLIALSEDAQLMVLGARGSGGLLAGSTAIALVAHGHSPVAVIRGGETDEAPPSEGPVVVGVDGSPISEPALAMAFEEAAMRGTDLVAVHAWVEFTSDTAYATARQFLVDWEAVETREREMLAERLAGWQEKYPDVAVRRVVTGGRPAGRLLDAAEDGQLLVVGSRGRGGFAGMLLGSTSQALIHHAPCPLMVVRPSAAD
ncbi:universal stress protein [Actinomadura sp. DC4]|uniref:universal stress protein n=1 Tax=Actinomadura sp. DC4 TaxID=3055069 RepID=UPI0025AF10B6|nr:universal stress protein [Actinomadura sp. DC4]MDN3359771.1 universal stress protein [Actinomadura sp. DC4]